MAPQNQNMIVATFQFANNLQALFSSAYLDNCKNAQIVIIKNVKLSCPF